MIVFLFVTTIMFHRCRNLVDAVSSKSRSGKDEDIPHSDSCLTCLLQESLGGNAKLSVICSITPDITYLPGLMIIICFCVV